MPEFVINEVDPRVVQDIEHQRDKFNPDNTAATEIVDNHDDVDVDVDVASFIESVRKSELDPVRNEKKTAVAEDKRIYRLLSSNLPSDDNNPDFFSSDVPPMMMKGTLYFQIMRKYDESGIKLPKIKATKKGRNDADTQMVTAVKDHIFDVGEFEDAYEDVFDGFKAEGTVVMQIGFVDDRISYEKVDLMDVHFDPIGITINNGKSRRKGRTIKWAVRSVEMEYKDFIEMFPEFAGKVAQGSPQSETSQSQGTDDLPDESLRTSIGSRITVHYAYNIGSLEPVMAIYAGGSATLIEKKSGKDYPFFDTSGKAFLPFEIFQFVRSPSNGLYRPSIIGIIKDGAEALKRMMNQALPNIARSVNPYVFLFGTTDDRIREEMKVYNQMQELGQTPIIMAGDQQVSMQNVAPASVFNEFEGFKKIILDDMGARIGLNLRVFEEVEQTATEFVGKDRQENTSISSLNRVNKRTFEGIAEKSIALAQRFWKSNDETEINLSITTTNGVQEDLPIPFKALLELLKEWDGKFIADTDVKSPMTEQERSQGIDEINAQLSNILNATNFTTKEQIKPTVDLLFEKIVLRELDNVVSRPELDRMIGSIIQERQPKPEQGTDGSQQNVPGVESQRETEEKQASKELSPLSFLAR